MDRPAPEAPLRSRLVTLAGRVVDALLPIRCVACDARLRSARARPATPFCPPCEAELPWWRRVDGCPRCGDASGVRGVAGDPGAACPCCLSSGSPLHRCTSLLRYEGPVARWIPGFKRAGHPFGPPLEPTRVLSFLAARLAARIAAEAPRELDVLMPIPSPPWRRLRRGFDPATWIAARLALDTGLPLVTGRLIRNRFTPPQASLHGEARRQNVRNAFSVRGRLEHDERVGLVDDVLTTGATLESAANALIEAGAWEVRAFTLAATLPAAAGRSPRPRHPARTGGARRIGPARPGGRPILPPSPRRAQAGFASSEPSKRPIHQDLQPPDGGARSP